MIFPQKVIWWGNEDNRNRKKVSKYAGIQLVICFIIAIIIIPDTQDPVLNTAAPLPSSSPAGKSVSTIAQATQEPGVSRKKIAAAQTSGGRS